MADFQWLDSVKHAWTYNAIDNVPLLVEVVNKSQQKQRAEVKLGKDKVWTPYDRLFPTLAACNEALGIEV